MTFRNIGHLRTMKKATFYDGTIWMETAVGLHHAASKNLDAPLSKNRLNIAHVCAGYAFELLFKIPVNLSGNSPKARHETRIAYEDMDANYKDKFAKIAAKHGWEQICDLLEHLDGHVHHQDRKYWMISRSGTGITKSKAFLDGKKAIPALAALHKDLSEFVLDAINQDAETLEVWD